MTVLVITDYGLRSIQITHQLDTRRHLGMRGLMRVLLDIIVQLVRLADITEILTSISFMVMPTLGEHMQL